MHVNFRKEEIFVILLVEVIASLFCENCYAMNNVSPDGLCLSTKEASFGDKFPAIFVRLVDDRTVVELHNSVTNEIATPSCDCLSSDIAKIWSYKMYKRSSKTNTLSGYNEV